MSSSSIGAINSPPPAAFRPHDSNATEVNSTSATNAPPRRGIVIFSVFLFVNAVLSVVFMTPLFTSIETSEAVDNNSIFSNYTLSSTLLDLFFLATLSIVSSIIALYKSYHSNTLHLKLKNKYLHIERYKPNHELKTREEIEQEAIEENLFPHKILRYISRYTFIPEIILFIQGLLVIAKCLARLNVEIGYLDEELAHHPIYWISLLISSLYCVITCSTLEYMCMRLSSIGHYNRQQLEREERTLSQTMRICRRERQRNNQRNNRRGRNRLLRFNINHNNDEGDVEEDLFLQEPLLPSNNSLGVEFSEPLLSTPGRNHGKNDSQNNNSNTHLHNSNSNINGDNTSDANNNDNQEQENQNNNTTTTTGEPMVASSDITADANYKAGWKDLIKICYPDWYYFCFAFIFLILAAVAQVLIPRYTGNMLDAIATYAQNKSDGNTDDGTFGGDDGDDHHGSIWNVPGFLINMRKLLIAAVLGGIFSGIRGSIFTAVGARVNVRLRSLLMEALLSQDIGFFDVTKTGDITSRLSSDTTLVGDQVTLNVNVFLRSLVQALGVLIFMTMLSWQLTLLAFISVPAITILSRWYGDYVRSLTKLMQKKLADGNSISEAALGSMSTVRALGAESTEMKEFQEFMDNYLSLNMRNAVSYFGYCTFITALPQVVTAVVLFYGGLLVMADGNDHITSGELVSFLLYLSSLSDAFNSIGYIFASLTSAVGAADKVFELIHRKPARKAPTTSEDNSTTARTSKYQNQIEKFRCAGVRPAECSGEVTFNKVMMYYPARPQRRILNDMTLYVPSGAVAALVGPSGGGKSSIVSLIQNLYEPRSGDVFIDGIKIHDLSPDWLSSNVAVVSQEPTLFARSIRRNIIYGLEGTDQEPSMEEIEEAARLANAASFIENLPRKYETDVGERGVQLSGGQKQRIAIARALVRRPKILLLDEATSALDAESEAMVQEAIDNMISSEKRARGIGGIDGESSSMTVIIVAHRLSTVKNADIIFVVEEGSVVQSGSHNQLMKIEDGAYANLISRQIKDQDKDNSKDESCEGSMMLDDSLMTDSIATANDTSLLIAVEEKSPNISAAKGSPAE